MDVLLQIDIFEKVAEYLNIRDICKLRLVCQEMNEFLQENYVWRAISIVHFRYYSVIYQKIHLTKYQCDNTVVLAGEKFVCTVSPVYTETKCAHCPERKKICRHCALRDYGTRIHCPDCNSFVTICDICSIERDSLVEDFFKKCSRCEITKCNIHFNECSICYPCMFRSLCEDSDEDSWVIEL